MRKSIGRAGFVRIGLLSLAIAAAVMASSAHSALLENLYTVTVALDSPEPRRSTLRTDQDFDRFAMGELLIRLTGRIDAPTHPALVDLVRDASRYVVQRGNPDRDSLLIVFDSAGLQRALTARNQPFWGEERPLTLLWVAIDGGPGERGMVAASDSPVAGGDAVETAATALREELLAVAGQRGLPISLPLMDARDLGTVDFIDVWGLFPQRLEQASVRYGPDAVLAGRVQLGEAGIEAARWTLLRDGDLRHLPGLTVRSGLDGIADLYAQDFSGIGGTASARLKVTGIETLDDYGRVMSYLESLSVLEVVKLEQFTGTEMTLRVESRGGAPVLNRVLALGEVLSNSPSASGDFGGELIYTLTR